MPQLYLVNALRDGGKGGKMTSEVNIPEFLNNPKEYVTQTKEEYEHYMRKAVNVGMERGWVSGCKAGVCIGLLIALGICYVIFRINALPDLDQIRELPVSVTAYQ